ncbi:MAG: protein kinase [Myxococcales bacterium]|nr:protein kinase [Myxococcales bacterium]
MTAATPSDPRLGSVIDGRYTLVRRLGAGGTGVVYEAEQRAMGRRVAVKMLNAVAADDPEWVQRFRDEAMTSARLVHPNTIRVYDVGQTSDGALFMVMELLEGHSVRHMLREGAFAAPRVLKILLQACASLAEAHGLGIIHRDIKADNVFLLQMGGAADYVKVLDFSVAKLLHEGGVKTRAGLVLGTPQYMSPEQCRGLPLDPRSDLYSLGILAYEMATGRLPFTAADPRDVLTMQLRQPVPPLDASVATPLADIIYCALQKEPSQRFGHAGAMMRACEEALDRQGELSAPPPRASAPRLGPAQPTMVATAVEGGAARADAPGQAPMPVALPPGAKTLVASLAAPAAAAAAAADHARGPRGRTAVLSAPMPMSPASPRSPAESRGAGRKKDGVLLVLLGISIGVIAFVAVKLFLAL